MEEPIFSDFGIEILRRDGGYVLRYDAGHFAVQLAEAEITEAEATKAQLSEQDAYEVLLAIEKSGRDRKVDLNAEAASSPAA